MSQSDPNHVPNPTRIDIPPDVRTYVVTLLNQTLVCTVDLRSHVKQASWNVKGQNFVQLQTLFATIATGLDAYTDLVAERIGVLGGLAMGTALTAGLQSTLAEYPGTLVEGHAHVLALAERFAPYAAMMRADIAHAADVEDAGSAAIYTDISRGVDRWLWLLDVHLNY